MFDQIFHLSQGKQSMIISNKHSIYELPHEFVCCCCCFFLIGIHSMQGWTATTGHGITRKRNTKRLRHIGNLFRKNLQLKDVC